MKKVYKFLTVILTIIALVSIGVVFAGFVREKHYEINVGSGNISLECDSISLDETVFKVPGDVYSVVAAIQNVGTRAFTYALELELIEAGGLEDAVIFYIDGEYIGFLSDLKASGNTYSKEMGALFLEESKSHELTFEYHVGAASYYNDKTFKLDISYSAVQLDKKTSPYIFISDEYQLWQLTRSSFDYSNKTIILTNNINLSKDITFDKGVNIDLNGEKVNLNSQSICFEFETKGVFNIFSSRTGDNAPFISGGIIKFISKDDNLLLFDKDILDENLAVLDEDDLDGDIDGDALIFGSVSRGYFKDIYSEFFKNRIGGNLTDGEFDIYHSYKQYIEYFELNIDIVRLDNNINITETILSDGVVTIQDIPANTNIRFNITLDSQSFYIDARILGERDSIISKIEQSYPFISTYTQSNDRKLIAWDLFLPIKEKAYGAAIKWLSSREDVLLASGKFIKPYVYSEIDLTAIISFNGINEIRTYYLKAEGQSLQDIMNEIAANNSMKFLTLDTTFELPSVINYEYMGFDATLGDKFEFDLMGLDTYFAIDTVDGAQVLRAIKEPPTFSQIKITGTLGEETKFSLIDIESEIIGDTAIYELIEAYLKNEVIKHENFSNINLPGSYFLDVDSAIIEYSVLNTVWDNGEKNPDNIGNYFNIVQNEEDYIAIINRDKLPNQNTVVYIVATMIHGSKQPIEKLISVNLLGILYYNNLDKVLSSNGEYRSDFDSFNFYYKMLELFDTKDNEHEGYLTADEATNAAITTIEIIDKNIESIRGLERFVNLQKINLSGNKINDISYIQELYLLTELNLSNNKISNLTPLEKLKSLKKLHLSNNEINDIFAIGELTNLEDIDLSVNNLNSYEPISYLKNVKNLRLLDTMNVNSLSINRNHVVTAYNNGTGTKKYYLLSSDELFEPSLEEANASRVLGTIQPVYEFKDILFLPSTVSYGGNNYDIDWETPFKNIIDIQSVTGKGVRAYITQPIADVNVIILSKIKMSSGINAIVYIRSYSVLSRQSQDSALDIQIGDETYVSSKTEILDDNLRYALFKHFDSNADGIITLLEIEQNAPTMLNLSGLGIRSLKGIEYFNGITAIDLRDNDFALPNGDYNPLSDLSNITSLLELYLKNGEFDFSALLALDNLATLNIIGCINTDSYIESLRALYNKNVSIIKDSLSEEWTPYLMPLAAALSKLPSAYVLYGHEMELPAALEMDVEWFDQDDKEANISYNLIGTTLCTVKQSGNVFLLERSKYVANDTYNSIEVTLEYRGISVSKRVTVVIVAHTNINIEVNDVENGTTYVKLYDVVLNDDIRQAIIGELSSQIDVDIITTKYITKQQLENITELEIYSHKDFGLSGLQYLPSLTSLIVKAYINTGEEDFISFSDISGDDLPSLIELSILYSHFDVQELNNQPIGAKLSENLQTLKMDKNAYINLNVNKADSTSDSVFLNNFANLTTLHLTSSFKQDLRAIGALKKVHTLHLYGNTKDGSLLQQNNKAVGDAYDNMSAETPEAVANYQYYITENGTLWLPSNSLERYIPRIETLNILISDANVQNIQAAKATIHRINYVSVADKVLLPESITIEKNSSINTTSVTRTISWQSTAIAAINVDDSTADSVTIDGKNYSKINIVNDYKKKAYVVITGTVAEINAVIEYAFVIDGNSSGTITTAVMDLNDFYDNGEIEDAVFVYRLFKLLDADSKALANGKNNGIYKTSFIEGITTLRLENTSALDRLGLIITSIRGIRNFKGLKTLRLEYNGLTDLTEVYYLKVLSTLYANHNNIITLEGLYGDAEGKSIFYENNELTTLRLQNNYMLQDYEPIVDRKEMTSLKNLISLYIYNGSDLSLYDEEFINLPGNFEELSNNKYKTIYKLWKTFLDGQNATGMPTKAIDYRIVSNPTGSNFELSSESRLVEFVGLRNALKTISPPNITEVDTYLLSNITYNGSSKSINWIPLGNQVVLDGNKIVSVHNEVSSINHSQPFRVVCQASFGLEISVVVYVNFAIENTTTLGQIQLSQDEMRVYYKIAVTDDNNYIDISELIPDPVLRAALMYAFEKSGDGIISIDERKYAYNTVGVGLMSFANKGIVDMTGIELFPYVTSVASTTTYTLNFNNNYLRRIPNLNFESGISRNLDVSYNHLLYDLSGLSYVSEQSSGDYVTLGSLVKTLNLSRSTAVNNLQIEHLKSLTNATLLSLDRVKITDFSFLAPDVDGINNKTLALNLDTASTYNFIASNLNTEYLTSFYLHREMTSTVPGIAANLIANYIDLESSYDNVGTFALPSTVTIYGTQYNLIWEEIADDGRIVKNDISGIYEFFPKENDSKVDAVVYTVVSGNTTYSETISLIVSNTVEDEYAFDAVVVFDNGKTKELSYFVPDINLRYYLINYFDIDKDGTISNAELNEKAGVTRRTLDLNVENYAVLDFSGMALFKTLRTLNLRYFYTNDLSGLLYMPNAVINEYAITTYTISSITIRDYNRQITDFSVLENFKNLTTVSFRDSVTTNMAFLQQLPNLKNLSRIDYKNGQTHANHIKTAAAYGRVANVLTQQSSGTYLEEADFYTDENHKFAAVVLSKFYIDDAQDTSYYNLEKGESYLLFDKIEYNGELFKLPVEAEPELQDGALIYTPLSDAITINQDNELTIDSDTDKNEAGLLISIVYNGVKYDRYVLIKF